MIIQSTGATLTLNKNACLKESSQAQVCSPVISASSTSGDVLDLTFMKSGTYCGLHYSKTLVTSICRHLKKHVRCNRARNLSYGTGSWAEGWPPKKNEASLKLSTLVYSKKLRRLGNWTPGTITGTTYDSRHAKSWGCTDHIQKTQPIVEIEFYFAWNHGDKVFTNRRKRSERGFPGGRSWMQYLTYSGNC